MRRTAPAASILAAGIFVLAAACGGTSAPPLTAPSPPPAATPSPSPPVGIAGVWQGSATDSQGDTRISWSLTQSGNILSGTVKTQAVNPDDGSCNSCHRNKSGSVSGTMSGTTLTLNMLFAAGVDGDPTPACSATLTSTATVGGERALTGTYSGSDTCEGPFANGTLAMTRQP